MSTFLTGWLATYPHPHPPHLEKALWAEPTGDKLTKVLVSIGSPITFSDSPLIMSLRWYGMQFFFFGIWVAPQENAPFRHVVSDCSLSTILHHSPPSIPSAIWQLFFSQLHNIYCNQVSTQSLCIALNLNSLSLCLLEKCKITHLSIAVSRHWFFCVLVQHIISHLTHIENEKWEPTNPCLYAWPCV